MTGSGTVSAPHGSTSLPRSPRITAGVSGVCAEARRQAAGAPCSRQPTSRFFRELASPQPSTTIRCQRRRLPREEILALTTLVCPGPPDNCSVPACRGVLRMARREVRKIETIERGRLSGDAQNPNPNPNPKKPSYETHLTLPCLNCICRDCSERFVCPASSPTRSCQPLSYSKPTQSQMQRKLRGCTKHMPSQYKLELQRIRSRTGLQPQCEFPALSPAWATGNGQRALGVGALGIHRCAHGTLRTVHLLH